MTEVRYLQSGERSWAGIKFLNAYPLVRGLDAELPGWRRTSATPSECASLLDAGRVELALVPLITAAVNGWPFLGDIGIGCKGPVTSVKLIYHDDLKKIETYKPDPASGTSNVLARLIYNLEFGRDLVPDFESEDAEIVIGDRAFEADMPDQWDLGAAWNKETGLPFVFGVWAARDEKILREVGPTLITRAHTNLLEDRQLIQEASRLTGKLINVHDYLYVKLHYKLEEMDHLGMQTFVDLANKYGLIHTKKLRMILMQAEGAVR